ncbi:MAG: outer membrane protein [Candidatus Aminicenantaceae bacterium]
MKKFSFVLILLMVFSGVSFGQKWLAGAYYKMSFPAGSTKGFIEKTSFLGGGAEVRRFMSDYWSLGASVDYSYFKQDNAGEAGTLTRTLKALPVMATLHFYVQNNAAYLPFAGVRVGGFLMSQTTESPEGTITGEKWHLGFIPEVGAIFKLSPSLKLIGSFQFNYAVAEGVRQDQAYYALTLGLFWNSQ